ncbi:MAG: hypothetical protein ABJO28_14490 [Maribacter dokdonensis]|uniref:hypothetical protein n=1 Tax=Maribacter dokdonensis TaxID=320912 RepID=UPI003266612A
MSKIGFGTRNLRVKTYPISDFDITEDEAESFAIKFDGFDIWNSNKKINIETPQIEKRVKYFHISFIPIFSTGTFWTTRKKDGLLYLTNEKCERKILKKIKKNRSPFYINLIPILASLFVIGLISYFSFGFIQHKIRGNKLTEQLWEKSSSQLIDKINKIKKGSVIEFEKKGFAKVIKKENDILHLAYLPDNVDEILFFSLKNRMKNIPKAFKKYESTLIKKSIDYKDLITMVPKNHSEKSEWYDDAIKNNLIVEVYDLK